MKLAKGKQFLADEIHASGNGWPHNISAKYAAQCKKGNIISFYENPPNRLFGEDAHIGDFCGSRFDILCDKLSPNWHQTCLSREEYFSAYPAELAAYADGWIEWKGGECPVAGGLTVYVNYRDGGKTPKAVKAESQRWNHSGLRGDIMSFSLDRTAVGADFCESVTRSIPETDAKPTIEQLASDYRNAKNYAERKQQEADDSKAAADAELGELVAAGKAIGLVIGIAKPEPVTAKFTGKFHSAKHGDRTSHLDMI